MNMRYKWLCVLSLIILGEFSTGNVCAGKEARAHIGEVFSGEVLKYEIGFWFLFPVAQGKVRFQEAGLGKYQVWHEGQTLGLVGWLTGHRQEIYKSLMTTTNAGRRLIPLRFEEEIISWGRVKTKKTIYDYSQRKIIIIRETGQNKSVQEKEIPWGFFYDDPVTAFYNFRHEVYGRVEQGKEFILRTIPEKGEEVILIRVAPAEETEVRRAEEKNKERKDFLVHIILNREMWGKKKVEIEIWFDKGLTPVSGMVKDLPLFGNIYGKCTYRGFSP
jgi:hypothetical protein